MVDEEVAARLAREVLARRKELGLSQGDVVVVARNLGHSLSTQTMNAIEQSKRDELRPRTAEALEAALGWERGSVTQIRAGNRPRLAAGNTVATLAPPGDELAALRRDLDALRRQVAGGEPGPADEARTLARVLEGLTPEARRTWVEALGLLEDEDEG